MIEKGRRPIREGEVRNLIAEKVTEGRDYTRSYYITLIRYERSDF
jgi:hypothetical protein